MGRTGVCAPGAAAVPTGGAGGCPWVLRDPVPWREGVRVGTHARRGLCPKMEVMAVEHRADPFRCPS